jgi:hypothetical protein
LQFPHFRMSSNDVHDLLLSGIRAKTYVNTYILALKYSKIK